MPYRLARVGRLRMLRGLPFSNVLGRWSGHSWSSSPDSCASGGSCSWISSGSSGPTSFSCEPVWCMCAHEWSARCPSGCSYEEVPKDHDMMPRWHTWSCALQGGQHHPRTTIESNIYCILFYNHFSNVTSNPQFASKIHQTQTYSIQPIYIQQFIIFFIHF